MPSSGAHDDSSSNGSPMKRRRSPSSSPEGRPRKEKNAFEVDPANARPEEKLIAEIMKMTKENLNKTTVRDSEMFLSDVFRLVRVFFGEVGFKILENSL